ncbi:MAG: hypothetical protein ACKVQT_04480 [Burkholderiales bacterium]
MIFVIMLIVFEWRVASRKKSGVTMVDRKMMRGMFGIGMALAGVVWFLQGSD